MIEDRHKVSGELFKRVLTHMDSLSRAQLVQLQDEINNTLPGECSPALYHMIKALEDLAKVELVNRDLMDNY